MAPALADEGRAGEQRRAGQHSLKLSHRLPDVDALLEVLLSNRPLMLTRPPLDDGDCLTNFAHRYELPQQQHRVGWPHNQVTRASCQPDAEQGIERIQSALDRFTAMSEGAFRRHESGVNIRPSPHDAEVVLTLSELLASCFGDLTSRRKTPYFGARPSSPRRPWEMLRRCM
jgi:hypothetical protein